LDYIRDHDLDPGDTFILYMQTHGYHDVIGNEPNVHAEHKALSRIVYESIDTTGDEILLLAEDDQGNAVGLYDDDLTQMFGVWDDAKQEFSENEAWKSVSKLFIFDACFGGGFWGDADAAPTDPGDLNRLSGAALLAAAPEAKFAYTAGGKGVFSEALLKALADLAGEERVSFNELEQACQAEWEDIMSSIIASHGPDLYVLGLPQDNWSQAVDDPVAELYAESTNDFDMGLGIPEPATLSLLAVGSLAIVRRRRRTATSSN